jgi:transposase, IS5 family
MFRTALSGSPARRLFEGRPAPFDPVLMFKVLIWQAMHSISDERYEYLIKDRLSFMHLLGLGLADVSGRQYDLDIPRGVSDGERH